MYNLGQKTGTTLKHLEQNNQTNPPTVNKRRDVKFISKSTRQSVMTQSAGPKEILVA